MEAHSALAALIAEHARAGERSFGGVWVSSLTESAVKGLPDHEIQGFESRLQLVAEILRCSDLPIIVDGDTGGTSEQALHRALELERMGVSALVIEDKEFPKRNSFDEEPQTLEAVERFAAKIGALRKARRSPRMQIVARTEALILGHGMEVALARAVAYVEAGADGIVIHSKARDAGEVLAFARRFRSMALPSHLWSIPTTYNSISDTALFEAGFSVVIHANHLLRASFVAMQGAAERILLDDRSLGADQLGLPVSQLLAFTEAAFERRMRPDEGDELR
jgi:phosphoenolpyruvate phosphomutase